MSNKSRRILVIIHGLTTGGAEVDVLRKSEYLAKNDGYEITVCCLMRRGDLAEQAEASGIKVIGPLMANRYDVTAARTLGRLVTSGNYDLVHSQIFAANLVTWLTLNWIGKDRRPPWVASEHAMADRWGRLALGCTRRIARAADAFTVPSATAKSSYVDAGVTADAIEIMPNGIDTLPFDRQTRSAVRKTMRRQLGIEESAIVIGTVCRLEPVKNLTVLVKAIAPLGLLTLIVGDGSQRDLLEVLTEHLGAPGQFRFLGRRNEITDLLSTMDLFVSSSSSESFGMAVAEALMAATPVVATDVGAIFEITNSGQYADLVPSGDIGALRDAVCSALEDPAAAQRRARSGGEFVRQVYSLDDVAKQLDGIYSTILDSEIMEGY